MKTLLLGSALLLANLSLAKAVGHTRLNFAPNITKHNTRWPTTLSWERVCKQVHELTTGCWPSFV